MSSPTERLKSKIRQTWLLVALLPTAILFLEGCEEPLLGIGSEVLPPGDLIETRFSDSLDFEFRSIRLDSVSTFNAEQQLVGNYIDPLFGRISASTYCQVLSRTEPVIGNSNLLFDSLVLKLQFSAAYGRTEQPLELSVHEITGAWPAEENINSETVLSIDETPLNDPVELQLGEEGDLQVSIRLSDALGQRLLYASPEVLGDRDQFLQLFKGLYLTTRPVQPLNREPGAIYRLVASGSNTQLELHYREEDENSTVFRAKIEPFQITGSTPRFHQVSRDLVEGTLLDRELSMPEDTLENFEFLQGVVQIRNFVKIGDLSQLGRVSINQAELVLKVDPETLGSNDRYLPPTAILPLAANINGEIDFDEEGQIDLITAIGGVAIYDATRATYTINLTRYLQEILTGQRENNGFLILPASSSSRVNRAVIGGIDHPALAPELNITYSTLPQ